MIRLALMTILCAWAAQALTIERLFFQGKPTFIWILSCNDGTMWYELHRMDGPGPLLYDIQQKCKDHGGMGTVQPGSGPVIYEVLPGSVRFASATLGDLVTGGAVTPEDARALSRSADQAVWGKTPVVARRLKAGEVPRETGQVTGRVTVQAMAVEIPDGLPDGPPAGGDSPALVRWLLGALAAALGILGVWRWRRRRG
jgi:hypothetical protein